ncbi:hypothetical protein HK104_007518 [Borealophlyctis nickersoniae]|nr:hypothetical protein HK104_007518 [Borealophlyctis nickersoniae]
MPAPNKPAPSGVRGWLNQIFRASGNPAMTATSAHHAAPTSRTSTDSLKRAYSVAAAAAAGPAPHSQSRPRGPMRSDSTTGWDLTESRPHEHLIRSISANSVKGLAPTAKNGANNKPTTSSRLAPASIAAPQPSHSTTAAALASHPNLDALPYIPTPPPGSRWSNRRRSVNLHVDTANAVAVMQARKKRQQQQQMEREKEKMQRKREQHVNAVAAQAGRYAWAVPKGALRVVNGGNGGRRSRVGVAPTTDFAQL